MRRLEKFTDGYFTGLRSDSNGPSIFESRERYTNFDKSESFHSVYKVAKPYIRSESTLSTFPDTILFTETGLPKRYTYPTGAEVLAAVNEVVKDTELKPFAHYVLDPQSATNRSIEKALAYGNLLGIVTASEAKQTVQMVRGVFLKLFNSLMSVYRDLKKLRLKGVATTVSDLWLEARYGWRPLLADIENLADYLLIDRPRGIKSAYGTDRVEDFPARYQFNEVSVDHPPFRSIVNVISLNVTAITHKVGYNYVDTENSRNLDWKAILGIDFKSLLSTAWDLIPFSFVIDMFTNIGSCLRARDVSSQVDTFNWYSTSRTEAEIVFEVSKVNYVQDENLDLDIERAFERLMLSPGESKYLDYIYSYIRRDLAQFYQAKFSRDGYVLNYSYLNNSPVLYVKSDRSESEDAYIDFWDDPNARSPAITFVQLLQEAINNFRNHERVMGYRFPEQDFDVNRYALIPKLYSLADPSNPLEPLLGNFAKNLMVSVPPATLKSRIDTVLAVNPNGLTQPLSRSDYHPQHAALQIKVSKFPNGSSYNYSGYAITAGRTPEGEPLTGDFVLQSSKVLLLERRQEPTLEFSQTFDTDISSAQIADLTAIGYQLVTRLKS